MALLKMSYSIFFIRIENVILRILLLDETKENTEQRIKKQTNYIYVALFSFDFGLFPLLLCWCFRCCCAFAVQ